MTAESPFLSEFRTLLVKHQIKYPRFAHGMRPFDPAKLQVLYSGPVYDQEEIVAAVGALVEGKWSVAGEHTHKFERLFSQYLNQAESVAVNSGSSADLLMVAAAKKRFGWRDGDGVIVSPANFPTTISAIALNNLTPVFVDIEWETLNADNDAIEGVLEAHCRYLTKNLYADAPSVIRAILISPVLGNPPDIDRLTKLAARYGVKLFLDGCDSLGSTWRGKHLAEYVTVSTCSLFPSHHISVLNGGMVSSNDTELIRWARCMSQWSRSCYCVGQANLLPKGTCGRRFSNWLPTLPDVEVDHKYCYVTDQAYNLQQVDLLSAMGCVQMGKMEEIHAARRVAAKRIRTILFNNLWASTIKVWTASTLAEVDPSWFGVPIICPNYDTKRWLQAHFEANSIQTRNYFAGSVLQHKGYAHLGRAEDYPNAQQVLRRVFFIGCAPFYTEEHFAHIEATFRSFADTLQKAA